MSVDNIIISPPRFWHREGSMLAPQWQLYTYLGSDYPRSISTYLTYSTLLTKHACSAYSLE